MHGYYRQKLKNHSNSNANDPLDTILFPFSVIIAKLLVLTFNQLTIMNQYFMLCKLYIIITLPIAAFI